MRRDRQLVPSSRLPRYGQRVVGVYDVRPEATLGVRERYGVETVFGELYELLGHPEIEIVDIATHPDVRPALVRQALAAGKHVLAQKPFADDLDTARELVEEAERLRSGSSPSTRTRAGRPPGAPRPAYRAGCDRRRRRRHPSLRPQLRLHARHRLRRDRAPRPLRLLGALVRHHALLARRQVRRPRCERASTGRRNQPPESKAPWGAWATIDYEDGSSALIRGVGCAATSRPRKPFWIHGSRGHDPRSRARLGQRARLGARSSSSATA